MVPLPNKMERVYLRSYSAAVQGAATLFADRDCKGYSGSHFSHDDPSQPAKYNAQYLSHIGNDRLSSVMIPLGYSVIFCKDNGFLNCDLQMDGLQVDNFDSTGEMKCQNLPDDWDE